jgi:hypothetical protein
MKGRKLSHSRKYINFWRKNTRQGDIPYQEKYRETITAKYEII